MSDNKRLDKIDTRITDEVTKYDAKLARLWEVLSTRITNTETKIAEVNDRIADNYQKIILLALVGMGSLFIALLELMVHHA